MFIKNLYSIYKLIVGQWLIDNILKPLSHKWCTNVELDFYTNHADKHINDFLALIEFCLSNNGFNLAIKNICTIILLEKYFRKFPVMKFCITRRMLSAFG